ncbi:MAG: transporter, partial [Thermodesulfobacteriota bacterium]|nr:transporter [Thermodesulfobacteriota bacterium]
MSLKHLSFLLGAGLIFLVLALGCARVGPDYRRPDIGVVIPESFQHAPSEGAALQAQDKWWLVFGDPDLNQLVEEALANNLDIKKAAAAILEIR